MRRIFIENWNTDLTPVQKIRGEEGRQNNRMRGTEEDSMPLNGDEIANRWEDCVGDSKDTEGNK